MNSSIIAKSEDKLEAFMKEVDVDAVAAITKLVDRCSVAALFLALVKMDSTNNAVVRQTVLADHFFMEQLGPLAKVVDEHKGAIESVHCVFMCSPKPWRGGSQGVGEGAPKAWDEGAPKAWERGLPGLGM